MLKIYDILQQSDQADVRTKREAIEGLFRFYISWAVAEPGTGKLQTGHEWQKRLAEFDRASLQKTRPGTGHQEK